jgi:hypothetical protein
MAMPASSSDRLVFQGFLQQRTKQRAAAVHSAGKARFQPVTCGHQFVDLGDNAALFGDREASCNFFGSKLWHDFSFTSSE